MSKRRNEMTACFTPELSRRRFLGGMMGAMVLPVSANAEFLDRLYSHYSRNPNEVPLLLMSPTFRGRLNGGDEHTHGMQMYLESRKKYSEMLIAARSDSNVAILARDSGDPARIALGTAREVVEAYARRLGDGDYRFRDVPSDAYWQTVDNVAQNLHVPSRFLSLLRNPKVRFLGKAIKWALKLAGLSSFSRLPGTLLNNWAERRISRDENPMLSWVHAPKQTGYPVHSSGNPLIYANDGALFKAYYPPIFGHIGADILGAQKEDILAAHTQGIVVEADSQETMGQLRLQPIHTPSGNRVFYATAPVVDAGITANLVAVANPDAPDEVAYRYAEYEPTFA